jgi:hypothetical protein
MFKVIDLKSQYQPFYSVFLFLLAIGTTIILNHFDHQKILRNEDE